ncbi:MAG: alpha/beta hydrolase [Betaproteobacteria bacterium]|nr:alpha/beta hydrolase [Betaproteobacteria bacterium]
MAAFAADRLPSGATYKDVLVATVQDAGKPYALRVNIYLPKGPATAPVPLVLFLHGNGGKYNFANGSRSYEFSIALTDRGIAVATIDYRPDEALPGEIHDVKAYVRWFRAKAKDYNIDPNRIGVWGTSRGGHLAALLAATGDVKELEGNVGGNLEQSSRIQCAVLYYAAIDLLTAGSDLVNRFPERAKVQDAAGELTAQLLGVKDSRGMALVREVAARNDKTDLNWKHVELAQLSNPVNYVTKDDPPILLAHSAIDGVVAVEQSEKLYRKYLENGLDASLYVWTRGAHGAVGADIEAATSEWLVRKLLVELAPKK